MLAERDATVVIGDLLADAGTATAAEIATAGPGTAEFHRLDVTDADGVAEFARAVAADHSRIDGLMNNAGIVEDSATFDLDLETLSRTIAVNLTGSFLCAREVGRAMADGGGGAIVNVSSIAGLTAVHVAYDASRRRSPR